MSHSALAHLEARTVLGLAEPCERIELGHAVDLFRCLAFEEQLSVEPGV